MNNYDYLIKLLLLGDSGVGKSCMLLRFADDNFTSSFITTIGIDYKIRTIELDGKIIKLQIWDTAGQERFRTITQAYYRGAMGILLVYDVSNIKSFININSWIKNIEEYAINNAEIIMIGNKCDLSREVSESEGQKIAKKYNIKFYETSAKSDVNINEAFMSIVKDIKKKLFDTEKIIIDEKVTNEIDITDKPIIKTKCCSN